MNEVFCLDTNAVIAAINRRRPEVRVRLEAVLESGAAVVMPVLVFFEMHYGIAKSERPEANRARLAAFMALGITQWPFEADDAQEAGEIRAALERTGTPIGPYDLLIAGQARRRGATLVTANTKEFARVPGLKTEDWAAA